MRFPTHVSPLNILPQTQEDPSILRRDSAANNIKEGVFFTGNAEFRVSGEIIYILSLIKQCREKWVLEEGDFDHVTLAVLSHVNYQMTLWHVSWNRVGLIVHGRWPQSPLIAALTSRTRERDTED
ncbi:hypothetical protein ACOSQ2_029980 [Xanthoceras sorbifolium]